MAPVSPQSWSIGNVLATIAVHRSGLGFRTEYMGDNRILYFLMFGDFLGAWVGGWVVIFRRSKQRARVDTARSGASEP